MADLDRVIEALRNADAAGNIEDAQRLAAIANKLRGGQVQATTGPPDRTQKLSQEPEGAGTLFGNYEQRPEIQENLGAMPFVNRGIATVAGAIPDAIRAGVNALPGIDESNRLPEPAFGRSAIEGGMESIGANLPPEGQQPRTIPEYMGQVVGEATALLNPTTLAIKRTAQGTRLAGRVASNIWESMIKHPYLTMTSELTGAMAAGVGRGVSQQEFPDSPGLQTTSEIIGGVAGGLSPTLAVNTPTLVGLRAGKRLLQKGLFPFTKVGGKIRAGEHIKSLVASPEATAKNLTGTISDLPPAVATGEKKLVELYKAFVGQDPLTDQKTIGRLSNSIIKLEGQMRKMGYGSPELLAEITEKRIAAIELKLDRRILAATNSAQKKINALPVAKRKAAESRIVRNELENAMHASRNENTKLWADVDKNMKVGFNETRATYTELFDDLGRAQRGDIPVDLKTSPIIKGKKIKSTTVREMQSLRSKLLETARAAGKNGEWNKRRIASDVADAILSDLEQTGGDSQLRAAIAGTKQFKLRFESGETGRLLGFSKSGAPAINPDLALEMTLGRMGERGAIDLEKVVVSPAAREATERYLGRSFVDHATNKKTGVLNPIKAEEFVKNNEAILDQFPGLRNELTDTEQAQSFADSTRMRMEVRKGALRDPKISQSAAFLNKVNLGTEISSVFDSPRSFQMAKQMVKQARKDVSGDAIAGVKAGFVEHVLDKATVGPFGELGEQTLSGRTMLNFIRKNEHALRAVFDYKEITRMKRIGSELSKIETFARAKPGKTELELKDWASNFLRMSARLTGARLGGKVGAESMGGSLQYAQIFSSRAQKFVTWLSRDTAQQLIQDAVLSKDPALLQSLLNPIAKPQAKKNLIILNKNLNLWLGSTGARVMQDIQNQEP